MIPSTWYDFHSILSYRSRTIASQRIRLAHHGLANRFARAPHFFSLAWLICSSHSHAALWAESKLGWEIRSKMLRLVEGQWSIQALIFNAVKVIQALFIIFGCKCCYELAEYFELSLQFFPCVVVGVYSPRIYFHHNTTLKTASIYISTLSHQPHFTLAISWLHITIKINDL